MGSVKLFVLAILFIGTSGTLFSKYFKKHKYISFGAGIVSIIASFYLFRGVYADLQEENAVPPVPDRIIEEKLAILDAKIQLDRILKENGVSEDWRLYAKQNDYIRLNDLEAIVHLINKQNHSDALSSEVQEIQNYVRNLFYKKNEIIKEEEIVGRWKCRKTIIEGDWAITYPFFTCRIKRDKFGLFFEKISGSQRTSGYLFKNSDHELVFLGGSTVNDEPQISYSGFTQNTSTENDDIAKFFKKGNKLIGLFIGSDNERYEALELER